MDSISELLSASRESAVEALRKHSDRVVFQRFMKRLGQSIARARHKAKGSFEILGRFEYAGANLLTLGVEVHRVTSTGKVCLIETDTIYLRVDVTGMVIDILAK